jgi:hypothetical protein
VKVDPFSINYDEVSTASEDEEKSPGRKKNEGESKPITPSRCQSGIFHF